MKTESMLVRTLAKMAVSNDPGYHEVLRNECDKLLHALEEEDIAEGVINPVESAEVDLKSIVTEIIHEIGIPAHIKGYRYVREAIILAVNNAKMIDAITKELYPQVAKAFNTTPSRVERAIRHGVEVAWDRGDIDVLDKYFGNTVSPYKGKPTNSEFIALIVEHIRNM